MDWAQVMAGLLVTVVTVAVGGLSSLVKHLWEGRDLRHRVERELELAAAHTALARDWVRLEAAMREPGTFPEQARIQLDQAYVHADSAELHRRRLEDRAADGSSHRPDRPWVRRLRWLLLIEDRPTHPARRWVAVFYLWSVFWLTVAVVPAGWTYTDEELAADPSLEASQGEVAGGAVIFIIIGWIVVRWIISGGTRRKRAEHSGEPGAPDEVDLRDEPARRASGAPLTRSTEAS